MPFFGQSVTKCHGAPSSGNSHTPYVPDRNNTRISITCGTGGRCATTITTVITTSWKNSRALLHQVTNRRLGFRQQGDSITSSSSTKGTREGHARGRYIRGRVNHTKKLTGSQMETGILTDRRMQIILSSIRVKFSTAVKVRNKRLLGTECSDT